MFERFVNNSTNGSDARAEPRVKAGWSAQLLTEDGQRHAVKVVDISRSGAGMSGDCKLRIKQAIELIVKVPKLPDFVEDEVIQIHATVIYQTLSGGTWRSGLHFTDPTREQRRIFDAWLSQRGGA